MTRQAWQPPRGWPPPPQRSARGRGRRLLRGLLIGVPVVFGSLLVAGEIYGQATGCGSVDPTDPSNYSNVTMLNDTNGTVVIDDCPGAYSDAERLPVRLAPGHSYADHAVCGASGSGMTSWQVTTDDGRLLGYIAAATPRKHDGLVFRVSQASRDRRTPTPARPVPIT